MDIALVTALIVLIVTADFCTKEASGANQVTRTSGMPAALVATALVAGIVVLNVI